jgi:hypothetical protein
MTEGGRDPLFSAERRTLRNHELGPLVASSNWIPERKQGNGLLEQAVASLTQDRCESPDSFADLALAQRSITQQHPSAPRRPQIVGRDRV